LIGMSIELTPLPADLGTALLSLMIQNRGVQSEASQARIDHANELLDKARKQIEEALARAEEAQDGAGFWGELSSVFGGDVAAICGVVAAAALVAATGGAGAPAVVALAAAGLSTASTAGRELGLPPAVSTILGAAAALAGLAAGNLGAASSVWSTVATTARTAQEGATAVSIGATIPAGQYAADALRAEADGKAAEGREADALFRIDLALGILERAAKDLERGRGGAAALVASQHQGNTALIARIGANS
jgi:hypothetical protein